MRISRKKRGAVMTKDCADAGCGLIHARANLEEQKKTWFGAVVLAAFVAWEV